MKRKSILILAGATLLVGAVGATVYIRQGEGQSPASETAARIDSIARGSADASSAESAFPSDVAVPVEGVPAQKGTMVIAVTAAGEAAAWRQAVVSALVAGEVKQVAVRENEGVRDGAALVAVDDASYQLALAQAEAGLRQAQAKFKTETLFDDRITDPAVRAEREKTARANTGLDNAELNVQKAKLELSRTQQNAPFAARIASVKVVPGQWVSMGAELMTLVDISRIKVEVQVLESEVGLLAPGRAARVTFAAFPGEVFVGRIETINPLVDKTTRSAKVVVALSNRRGLILPGMYARVSLDARQLPDRIMVPRPAILERDRRKMLFVFEGEGTEGLAKWRYVCTGAENEALVEILEPGADAACREEGTVQPGEVVLTAGHHTLVHDARVRIVPNVNGAEGARVNQ
jgi:RND family efflux transporter MFP subunit